MLERTAAATAPAAASAQLASAPPAGTPSKEAVTSAETGAHTGAHTDAPADAPADAQADVQADVQTDAPADTEGTCYDRLLCSATEVLREFESSLLEALYDVGVAQPIEADGGLICLVLAVESVFMPHCLERLRELHAIARRSASIRLQANRQAVRMVHPEVIGLIEPLVASAGAPATTVVEATWLYMEACEELSAMDAETTIAAKLSRLVRVVEVLVQETQARCSELAADDLVPLMTLALVGARLPDLSFTAFVLENMLPSILEMGRESYCACTASVALGFLAELSL